MPTDRLGIGKLTLPLEIDTNLRVSLEAFATKVDDNMNYVLTPATELNSAAVTGGTGSAGAGKQYVVITIGGVKYKLLHDGTV
jgi:hypothetical protein